MQRDSDGVWSVKLTDYLFETFRYCFMADGTLVADPSNMYLSPNRGFKFSVADNPMSPFNFANQGEIEHGRTGYDLERKEAWYTSPMPQQGRTMPVFIQLVPGENDTMESWFKLGGADAIADRLIADGNAKPCIITTSSMDFMGGGGGGGMRMPGFSVNTLKADDYPTWSLWLSCSSTSRNNPTRSSQASAVAVVPVAAASAVVASAAAVLVAAASAEDSSLRAAVSNLPWLHI
jgi:hypothetical protein